MSKQEIEKVFQSFKGDFKLLEVQKADELKKYAKTLGYKMQTMKTMFCNDDKKAYAIVKVA